ncbi:hypothetical protein TNCT_636431 [Trichonephila clavata]|uniref:Uncharacterized protein n=1 Tax=Trichonephila clavata TaxID=2740835 RepID=A0A8X6F0W1_TRICU|nr:hypothetical protein TNCT_636431 [Trichonephila clavata]
MDPAITITLTGEQHFPSVSISVPSIKKSVHLFRGSNDRLMTSAPLMDGMLPANYGGCSLDSPVARPCTWLSLSLNYRLGLLWPDL